MSQGTQSDKSRYHNRNSLLWCQRNEMEWQYAALCGKPFNFQIVAHSIAYISPNVLEGFGLSETERQKYK